MTARVGYVGLGTMGEPMAGNVVRAGFAVTVFDLAAAPLRRLAELGAEVAESPAGLAARSDVVLVNVVNDAQVEDVVAGRDGLLESLEVGAVIVVHSTVHPDTCVRLADRAAGHGVGLIDAPFTGGAAAAAAGRLALLVGGDERAVRTARPVLEAEGTVHHLGAVGLGELAKLSNNLLLGVTLAAVHEALELAAGAGLDRQALLDVLAGGAADCWTVRNWAAVGQLASTYPRGAVGLAELTRKDFALALRIGDESGVALPLAALASTSSQVAYEAAQRYVKGLHETVS